MPRRARQESKTEMYHVMGRGINKIPMFASKRDKARMLFFIRENIEKFEVEIYAYCIMNNHFHLLIKSELKELSKFMAKIIATYAQYYNYKKERIGYVFQDRYKSECVETESYFWNCLRYIHLNPVKAEIIKDGEAYQYSSWREYLSQENDILHPKAFLMYQKRFTSDEEFAAFHKRTEVNVFEDIKEEKDEQKKIVAKYLLKMEAEKLNYTEEEVLAIGETRMNFREALEKKLSLSKRDGYQMIEYLKGVLQDDLN